jgi:hypothetical protein
MATRRKGPISERVRQSYNWTWFASLTIGEKYIFASDLDGYSTKTGVCEKVSARKFKKPDGSEGQVGSIEAIVVKLDKDGQPHKIGNYVPYLGD